MYDVAVIGAGVTGGLIARKLTSYKLNICILEAENDVGCGASSANSAIVHAGFDAKPGTLKARFNVEGSRMMERVCAELGVKYKRNGSLVIGFSEEDRKTLGELLERGRKNGVEGLYIAGGDEVRALEPELSGDVTCALVAPTGAIICPYELAVSAAGNAMDNGAELMLNFRVSSVTVTPDGFSVGAEDGRRVAARRVINCAGVYADRVAATCGDDSFRIRPRRGEYMLLDKSAGGMCSHTVFRTPTAMGKGILITPTVDGNLLLGPTSEDIDDKDDLSVTRGGLERIAEQVKREMPRVDTGAVITSFCGLRAVGNTGDFIINEPLRGFVNVAAIESPGLTSSPAIAEYVAEILENSGLKMENNGKYDPEHRPLHWFRELGDSEKNEVIARDPSYGRVVCRCEGVTEGEILYAISQNPRPSDLDGVKRRTRAQMGRCQGGFCSPYIVKILSDRLGIPFEAVTKSGGGSYINVGRTK